MNSVSKINVQIGSNAAQFAAGMGQASSAVGRFTASAGQMNMAVSQLAFAADDVVQVYGQSGVAGALNAASNNISMMAASLFGVKGLMIAVAASAATQLVMAFSKTKDQVQKTSEAIDELRTNLDKLDASQRRQRERQEAGRTPADNIRQKAGEAAVRIAELQRQFDERIEGLRTMGVGRLEDAFRKEDVINQWTMKPTGEKVFRFSDEIRKQATEAQELAKDIANLTKQIEIWNTRQRESTELSREARRIAQQRDAGRFQPFITSEMRSIMAGQLLDIDEELAAIRERQLPSFSLQELFSRFPGVNTFGSSGAISAINAAQFGPQNARDAGVMVQRQSLQELRRIRELEEKKKGLLEVVGL